MIRFGRPGPAAVPGAGMLHVCHMEDEWLRWK